MKQYKSPGLDGIINEFYQIYWDTIIDLRKNLSVHLVSRRYHILNYHLDL
jgi:hypothetical protein